MNKPTAFLLMMLLWAPVFAGEADWWNPAWKSRKRVRVELPRFDEKPGFEKFRIDDGEFPQLTARAQLHRETPSENSHKDVRVLNADGEVLPHRIYSFGDKVDFKVVFPVPARSADYYIYYDNPEAKAQEKQGWLPGTHSLEVVALKHEGTSTFELRHVVKGLQGEVHKAGKSSCRSISMNKPVKLFEERRRDPGLVVSYEGYLLCPVAGRYTFSINHRGGSYLFIDGKLVVEARALYPTPHTWPQPNNTVLKAGYHHVRLLLVKESHSRGAGLGWQMPGMEDIEEIPTGFYARYIDAEVTGLERTGQSDTAFFAYRLPPEAVNLWHPRKTSGPLVNFPGYNRSKPKPVTVAYTRFANSSSVASSDDVTWGWRIQRLAKGKDPKSGKKMMVLAPEPNTFETTDRSPAVFLEVGKTYRSELTCFRGGEKVSDYVRQFEVDPPGKRPGSANEIFNIIEKPTIRLEVLSAPNIVYAGEENNAAFRVVTNLNYPVPVDWQAWITRGNQRENNQTGSFLAGTGEDVVMTFPLRLGDFPERKGSMTVALSLHQTETNRVEFDIVPSPGDFTGLSAPRGYFTNEDGRRVVICTTYEREADYRRWMFLKAIGRSLDMSEKKVLIFGSSMTNTAQGGGEAVGYVDRLKTALKDDTTGVEYMERTGSLAPILTDVIKISQWVKKNKPEVVVIAPGLADVDLDVDREDFARGLDVIIDLLRSDVDYVRIVLVTPPPLVSNPRLSKLYAEEVRRIAGKHHTELADLHKMFTSRESWRDAYRISPGAEVFHLYPDAAAHKDIAELIADSL